MLFRSRLTGYKIDIKSESQAYDEVETEEEYMEDDIFLEEIPEEDEE